MQNSNYRQPQQFSQNTNNGSQNRGFFQGHGKGT